MVETGHDVRFMFCTLYDGVVVFGRWYCVTFSAAKAYLSCRRCGFGCLDIFCLYRLFFLSLFLGDGRYRQKYCQNNKLTKCCLLVRLFFLSFHIFVA